MPDQEKDRGNDGGLLRPRLGVGKLRATRRLLASTNGNQMCHHGAKSSIRLQPYRQRR